MIRIAHLLDDFAMGGVTRALGVFEEPELSAIADSSVHAMKPGSLVAPALDAEIIVTHFPPSWRGLAFHAGLRARNRRARIVHVEHTYTDAFERREVRSVRRFRAMLRAHARLVDEIVCVSNAQRRWLVAASGMGAAKARTIYPWSGRDALLELEPPAVRGGPGAPLRLGAYGRFSEVKNFAALIEAVGARPDSCSLLLGGSGPLEGELARAAAPYSNVTLAGQVEDVAAFLAQVDAVIVPSFSESYGLVATEARLAARPILVADVGGLPEQVGRGGLSAPMHDAQSIGAAIDRFRAMPLADMGMAARKEARGIRAGVIAGWVDLLTGR